MTSMIAPHCARSGGMTAVLTKPPHAYWKKSLHGSAEASIQSGTMPDSASVISCGAGAGAGAGAAGVAGAGLGAGAGAGMGAGFFDEPEQAAAAVRTTTTRRERMEPG